MASTAVKLRPGVTNNLAKAGVLVLVGLACLYSLSVLSGGRENHAQNGMRRSDADRNELIPDIGDGTPPPVVYNKRVLVTGAAGFVGMHLSISLLDESAKVVGLDNFNSYYDVQLKKDRAARARKEGISIVKGDVCDTELVMNLFREHKFTHVAHLAGQPGVRYSLDHPDEYVESNIKCFVRLLEVVRHFQGVKFIYASSSSVYGLNRVPFSVFDRVDMPGSLYGATKKADEVIAYAYHNLYGIPCTGLRFFTVYGEWGRPDMAVYDFMNRIRDGRAIRVYRNGTLERDFTYVGDIVQGIKHSLNLGAPYELFNLGKGHPEQVLDLIDNIERAMNQKASIDWLPMQMGDMVSTFADIEHTRKRLGYAPSTPLNEGIRRAAKWFKSYSELRDRER